jgi:tRNA dimethylallyltransferase
LDGSIPVLAGCTGTGKTEAAMAIASRVPGIEIVSADSRQIYRGMDIGTAKPSRMLLESVPHHLVNVAEPDRLFSAGWFRKEADRVIEEILSRGGIPLLVGGSALYLMALAGMVDTLPERNDRLRNALLAIEQEAPGGLHRLLRGTDPHGAAEIGPRDRVRLVRALEIALLSGGMASELRTGGEPDKRFRFAILERSNVELKRRIDARTRAMMEAGLPEEVRGLLQAGFSREPVMGATIGYSEIIDHIQGRCTLEQAEDSIRTNTWRYARRQRNMFRRLPGAITAGSIEELMNALFKGRTSHG